MALNLKVLFGADTKGIEQGAKKAAGAVNQFEKSSRNALSGVASMFGVNISKVQEFSTAAQGAAVKIAQSMGAGEKAISSLTSGTLKLAGGIAAISLTALIAGFRELNALADHYAKKAQGDWITESSNAYKDTFKNATSDIIATEEMAMKKAGLGEWWTKQVQKTRLEFAKAFQNPFKDYKSAVAADLDVINAKSERARQIALEIDEINDKQDANIVRIAELNNEIAQARLVVKDTENSIAERQAAAAAATTAIKEKYELIVPLASRLSELTTEYYGLTESTQEENKKVYEMQAQVLNLKAQEAMDQKMLLRDTASVNNELKKIGQTIQNNTSISHEWGASISEISNKITQDVAPVFSGIKLKVTPEIDTYDAAYAGFKKILDGENLQVSIKTQMTTESFEELNEQLSSGISSALESGLSNLGSTIGNIISGNISAKEGLLSFLTDLAVQVGKISIGIGTALLGIKASMSSFNPYVALAAGAALVALGTAAKNAISSAASDSYSASSSIGSSYSATSSDHYSQRDMTIKVAGVLTADGDQLVAVINNTENRRKYTT